MRLCDAVAYDQGYSPVRRQGERRVPEFSVEIWVFVFTVAFVAGFVKGVVGFAMPMVMISGLGSVLPPDLALAALMVPTVVTNTWQALRTGVLAAWASARAHWRFLAIGFVFLVGSAQLFYVLPAGILFLAIGIPVVLFSITQLVGWRLTIAEGARQRTELILGAIAGIVGGLSGVWGPPTVAYLTALDTPKTENIRVQGVVYGAGAIVLIFAHMQSGVFNSDTAPLSALLLLPAMAGLFLGFRVQDRMDQALFRKATLAVLVIAGLNLIRRGLTL